MRCKGQPRRSEWPASTRFAPRRKIVDSARRTLPYLTLPYRTFGRCQRRNLVYPVVSQKWSAGVPPLRAHGGGAATSERVAESGRNRGFVFLFRGGASPGRHRRWRLRPTRSAAQRSVITPHSTVPRCEWLAATAVTRRAMSRSGRGRPSPRTSTSRCRASVFW